MVCISKDDKLSGIFDWGNFLDSFREGNDRCGWRIVSR